MTLTREVGRKYLSVYGFGMSNSTLFPERGVSAGSVPIAINGSLLCGSSHSVALVHTLTLDVGLHKGRFNYIGTRNTSLSSGVADNETDGAVVSETRDDSEEPEVVVQPAMVGFHPTCDARDVCVFDSNSVCVGDEVGKKNCARCYTAPLSIDAAHLRVWVSYHGTDGRGSPMRSSGLNPLHFPEFAGSRLYSSILFLNVSQAETKS